MQEVMGRGMACVVPSNKDALPNKAVGHCFMMCGYLTSYTKMCQQQEEGKVRFKKTVNIDGVYAIFEWTVFSSLTVYQHTYVTVLMAKNTFYFTFEHTYIFC